MDSETTAVSPHGRGSPGEMRVAQPESAPERLLRWQQTAVVLPKKAVVCHGNCSKIAS